MMQRHKVKRTSAPNTSNKENNNKRKFVKDTSSQQQEEQSRRHTAQFYSSQTPSPQAHKRVRRVSFASQESQVKYFDSHRSPSSLAIEANKKKQPSPTPVTQVTKGILTASPVNIINNVKSNSDEEDKLQNVSGNYEEDDSESEVSDDETQHDQRLSGLNRDELLALKQLIEGTSENDDTCTMEMTENVGRIIEGADEHLNLTRGENDESMSLTIGTGHIMFPDTQEEHSEEEGEEDMSFTKSIGKIFIPNSQEVGQEYNDAFANQHQHLQRMTEQLNDSGMMPKESDNIDMLLQEVNMEFTEVSGKIMYDASEKLSENFVGNENQQDTIVPNTQEEVSSQQQMVDNDAFVPNTQQADQDAERFDNNNIREEQQQRVDDDDDDQLTCEMSKNNASLDMDGISDLEEVTTQIETKTSPTQRLLMSVKRLSTINDAHNNTISNLSVLSNNLSLLSNPTPKRISDIKNTVLNTSLTNKINTSIDQRTEHDMGFTDKSIPLDFDDREEEIEMTVREFLQTVNIRFLGDLSCRRSMSVGGFLQGDKPPAPQSIQDIMRVACIVQSEHRSIEELRQDVQQRIDTLKLELPGIENRYDEKNPPLFRRLFRLQQREQDAASTTHNELMHLITSINQLRSHCRLLNKISLYDMKIRAEKNVMEWISEHINRFVHSDLKKIQRYTNNLEDMIQELDRDILAKRRERESKQRKAIQERDRRIRIEQEQQERFRGHKTIRDKQQQHIMTATCTQETENNLQIFNLLSKWKATLWHVQQLENRRISIAYHYDGNASVIMANLWFDLDPITGQVLQCEMVRVMDKEIVKKLWFCGSDDTFGNIRRMMLDRCVDYINQYVIQSATHIKQIRFVIQSIDTHVGRCFMLFNEIERITGMYAGRIIISCGNCPQVITGDGFILPVTFKFVNSSTGIKFSVILNLTSQYPYDRVGIPLLHQFQPFFGGVQLGQIQAIINQVPANRFGRLTRLCSQFHNLVK